MMRMPFLLALLLAFPLLAAELPPRHHPVKVPLPEDMELPTGWHPDENNRLVCSTCHGVENIEKIPDDELDPDSPDFLREGPYPEMERFCFRCHEDSLYRRLNIHLQLDDGRNIRREHCLYCHRKVPDRENPPHEEELELRLPLERICLGCHLATPHLNALEHSRKPGEKQLEHMRRSERKLGIILPLDSQGRVTCVSCHSPHQKGVIDDSQPAGRQYANRSVEDGPDYRTSRWQGIFRADKADRLRELVGKTGRHRPSLEYRSLVGEVLMRLPAFDGSLCKACHRFDD